jgi:ribosome-associated protein YbcJ (S4-like RNA binding protein)
MRTIEVRGEYITLGQLLKLTGEISAGGEVKEYLTAHSPVVNGEPDNRRGRKLRSGDKVVLQGVGEIRLA